MFRSGEKMHKQSLFCFATISATISLVALVAIAQETSAAAANNHDANKPLDRETLASLSKLHAESKGFQTSQRCDLFEQKLRDLAGTKTSQSIERRDLFASTISYLAARKLPFGNSQPVLELLKECQEKHPNSSLNNDKQQQQKQQDDKREVIAGPRGVVRSNNNNQGANLREDFEKVRTNVKDFGQDLYGPTNATTVKFSPGLGAEKLNNKDLFSQSKNKRDRLDGGLLRRNKNYFDNRDSSPSKFDIDYSSVDSDDYDHDYHKYRAPIVGPLEANRLRNGFNWRNQRKNNNYYGDDNESSELSSDSSSESNGDEHENDDGDVDDEDESYFARELRKMRTNDRGQNDRRNLNLNRKRNQRRNQPVADNKRERANRFDDIFNGNDDKRNVGKIPNLFEFNSEEEANPFKSNRKPVRRFTSRNNKNKRKSSEAGNVFNFSDEPSSKRSRSSSPSASSFFDDLSSSNPSFSSGSGSSSHAHDDHDYHPDDSSESSFGSFFRKNYLNKFNDIDDDESESDSESDLSFSKDLHKQNSKRKFPFDVSSAESDDVDDYEHFIDSQRLKRFADEDGELVEAERELDPIRKLGLLLERERKMVKLLREQLDLSEEEMEQLTKRLEELASDVTDAARRNAPRDPNESVRFAQLRALYEQAVDKENATNERLEEALKRISELETERRRELIARQTRNRRNIDDHYGNDLDNDDDYDEDEDDEDYNVDDDSDDGKSSTSSGSSGYDKYFVKKVKRASQRALSLEEAGQKLLERIPAQEQLENRCAKYYIVYNYPEKITKDLVRTVARLELPLTDSEHFAPAGDFFDDLRAFGRAVNEGSKKAGNSNGRATKRLLAELADCLELDRNLQHKSQSAEPEKPTFANNLPFNFGGQEIGEQRMFPVFQRPKQQEAAKDEQLGSEQSSDSEETSSTHYIHVTEGPNNKSGAQSIPVHVISGHKTRRNRFTQQQQQQQQQPAQPEQQSFDFFGKQNSGAKATAKANANANAGGASASASASASAAAAAATAATNNAVNHQGLTKAEQEELDKRFQRIPDFPTIKSRF